MINVGFGGTLYQDMKEDAEPQWSIGRRSSANRDRKQRIPYLVTDAESSLGAIVQGHAASTACITRRSSAWGAG